MNTIYTIASPACRRALSIKNLPNRLWSAMGIHTARIAAFVLAWMLTVLWPAGAGAQSYTATLVQSAESSFQPSNLNDAGEVAGYYYPDGGTAKPVICQGGSLVELPLLPDAIGGFAWGLNNAGQVVGVCFDSNDVYRACIWQNGAVTELPVVAGAVQTYAIGINDAGGATGYALVPGGFYPDGSVIYRQDAVVWQGGSVQIIAPPDAAQQMHAHAIDASGRVAVSIYDEWMGGWMPGRWTPDVPNGLTGAVEVLDWGGFAYDINDSGVVCGYDGIQQAALWNGSTPTIIGVLPGHSWAYGTSINEANAVVGTSTFYYDDGFNYYEEYYAFVWDAQDGIRDVNELINSASDEIGHVSDAVGINNAGQILAFAASGSVLLTPSSLPPRLPAPTGLTSQAGNSSVSLAWNAVTVAAGYNVKRSTVSGGAYTTIATGVTSTSYVDQTAVNGIRYYYVVSALADTRESADSNETTARPIAPPVAPTGLAAKVTAKVKVTLTWRQSTSPEVLRNRIYRSTNGGAYVLVADVSASLTWIDNQAPPRANCSYVVTAVNSIGLESPASNAVVARVK